MLFASQVSILVNYLNSSIQAPLAVQLRTQFSTSHLELGVASGPGTFSWEDCIYGEVMGEKRGLLLLKIT